MAVSSRNVLRMVVAGVLIAPADARAIVRTFTMHADGACAGTSSQATADGTFTLDTESLRLTYDITLSGLTPVQMHVHGPAEVCLTGRFSPVFFEIPSSLHAVGSRIIEEPFPDLLLQGKMWFNVHTQQFTPGEITGQIVPQCVNDCSGRGTCNMGMCSCEPGYGGIDCSLEVPVPTLSSVGLVTLASLLMAAGAALVWKRRSPGNE